MARNLLILGAGPTGLGAAYRLLRRGHPSWSIRERNTHVGGLAASFRDEAGFTWDVGGHVVFSHYPEYDRFFEDMTRGQVFSHQRKSAVRIAGRFVPVYFQNNLHHLPPDLLEECLAGLEQVARRGAPPDTTNFLTWLRGYFGEAVSRLFMEPDNEKRWAWPLERLAANWMADRVSPVDLERVRENARLKRDEVSWGPNSTFKFPMHGGTGSIYQAMVPRLGDRLELGREATAIDPEKRTVRFAGGGSESYDRLLSTLPIDRLLAMIEGVPEALVRRAGELLYCNSFIVGIGLRRPCPSDRCWVYCPEPAAPFYRVTYFSNYSRYNVPDDGHYSLMCDVSYSDHLPRGKNTIVEECIQGLIDTGMIAPEDRGAIVSTHLLDAPYSYPVPSLERDAILADLHRYLEPLGIHSRGRFGTWRYEIGNMDHSVVMGMQWVDAMLDGARESIWLDRQ